jgi:hypothetical protein
MPNSPPRLDDRSFDNLVAELLARIPAHTPEWTDPRVGDPGRALIELFAWLGDTLLYRANLVPERQRLVFLKLLGMQLRPAAPAYGLVTVGFNSEDVVSPIKVRRGARIEGPPTFETRDEITVLPVEGRVYAKRRLSEDEATNMAGLVGDLMDLYRAMKPDQVGKAHAAVGYMTREVFPEGAPAQPAFDLINDTADKALWIALLAPTKDLAPTVRANLMAGGDGSPYRLNLGVVPAVAPIGSLDELPARLPRRMILEVMTAERLGGRYVFSQLDVASDTTIGLTGDGVLTAGLAVGSFGVPSNDVAHTPSAGMGDLPPRIDVEADAQRLVGWLRLRPAEPLTSLSLSWMGINAVEIDNLRTFTSVVVGTGNGRPDQVLSLPSRNVDATSIDLEVLEDGGGYMKWSRVDDLAARGRDDRVYVLDAETGTVRFGDGIRGLVVTSGARVRVAAMKAGGGVAGNLPPRSLSAITGEDADGNSITAPLQVTQRMPTRGGFDAESLAVAERRIPATLRHGNRAVTESDFRSLAATTPGLRVGRVEVLPRFKPQQRRQNVPGVISVLGVPASTTAGFRPPAPRPDRHFIETMYTYLNARRMLGTELYIIGPEYVPLSATVGIDVRAGFGVEQALAAVRLALRAFFWPLAPGGPGNRGWGLGQTIVTAHAEVAVARVPGVSALRGVRLFERDDGKWRELSLAGGRKLALHPWQLPELLHVIAVAGQDAPSEVTEAPNPFLDDGIEAIPIPIVPEVC